MTALTDVRYETGLWSPEDQTPHPAAFIGLAGEVVNLFRPHTESADVAILIDFLVSFGNAVGPKPYFLADAAPHPGRLNAVLVGATSRARKGSSRANVKWLMRLADPAWASDRVVSGLASGEGLIAALVPEKHDDDENPVPTDPRLMVFEPEFARTLKVAGRDGSTVSPILRQAWDSGDLAIMTRHSPLRAKGTHVSVLGHITAEELHRQLDQTEISNGLANRFLWMWVTRSKRLSTGGNLDDDDLLPLASKIRDALTAAKRIRRMRRSVEAERIWEAIYTAIDDTTAGMLGAVIARVEAQVLRLSIVYALLDGSSVIEAKHLAAACAVWDYSAISAKAIFADQSEDRDVDRAYEVIANSVDGIDLTGLTNAFSRHLTASHRDDIIARLEADGRVRSEIRQTAGRPRRILHAIAKKAYIAKKAPGITGADGLVHLISLLSLSSHPHTEEPPRSLSSLSSHNKGQSRRETT